MKDYIYIISNDQNYIKVGVSNNAIAYSESCGDQHCSANFNNGTQASNSSIISCYETSSFYIICFYQNVDKKI